MEPTLQRSGLLKGRGRVVVMAVVLLLMLVSWLGVIDRASTAYIDSSLVQASVAFGIARLLNGTISVLQSAQVEGSLLFFSGSIGIGEVLDPFNDLVEDYSSLMKLSIGSLLIQKVLLGIISDLFFKVLLTMSGLFVLLSLMRPSLTGFNHLMRTFIFLVFLRFALVLVVALNGVVDHFFLEDQSRESIAVLEGLPGKVEALELQAADDSEQASVSMDLQKAQAERAAILTERLTELSEAREQLLSKHVDAKAHLTQLESEVDTVQRYIPISRTPEHEQAVAEVDALEGQLNLLEDEQEKASDALEAIQRVQNSAAESGVSGGFMSGFGSTFASLAKPDTWSTLLDTLGDATNNIMQLMAVFVLRTLILPLLFLYCLSIGFKAIWRVDARDLMSRYIRDGKGVQRA